MIEVVEAPPYGTVQDRGRPGYLAQGIPWSGAMDQDALVLGNLLVGNAPEAAGLEWAAGPGRVGFECHARFAVTGSEVACRLGHQALDPWTAYAARPGDELVLGVPTGGQFAYLALEGGIGLPPVLGSRSTYLPGRLGGTGGLVRAKDCLGLGRPEQPVALAEGSTLPTPLRADDAEAVRIVDGPQADLFDGGALAPLLDGAFIISHATDRMGYRLEGPPVTHRAGAAIPSEPACPGAIQVPDGSAPIVLMPDGPTVGGYPKLAVVITTDLGRAAQHRRGAPIRFARVTLADAHEALRTRARRWREAAAGVSGGGGAR